jgi:hypothetical protein
MAVETTNLLLRPNLLQQTNELQQINLLLVPTQVIPPGPPPVTNNYGFELEDGSGVLLLEDGTSILLLENQS